MVFCASFKWSSTRGTNGMKKEPKSFTAAKVIFDLMTQAYETGREIDITGIKSPRGEVISRGTISMQITKNSADFFGGKRFYTRKDRKTEALILGCYESKYSHQ